MKRTILSLLVVSLLAWTAGAVLAQGQGKGKEQGSGAARANTPGQMAKVDANAPAAEKKMQDAGKGAREKAKDAVEQGQARGKAMREDMKGKMAETQGKAHEQQMRAFEKQAQQRTAKHMERLARLNRIRELAVQKGDQNMIARVDKLIAQENQIFDRKLLKLQGQNRAGGMTPPMQGKDKVEVDKSVAPQTLPPAPGTSNAPGPAAPPAGGNSSEAKPK